MRNLRNHFEQFCYRNRHKGIQNLMLYVMIANAIVYVMSMFDNSYTLYLALCFNRDLILQGQVWRLITFIFTGAFSYGSILLVLISSLCYYALGRAIENAWGTFRFNLFYLTGIVLMDIYAMFFNCVADPYYLNLSLLLSYSTLYPDARFLLFFFIPVKAWILALFDLALILLGLFSGTFPGNLFPLVCLLNYFFFFGKGVLNIIPISWQRKFQRPFEKKSTQQSVHFYSTGTNKASAAAPKQPYTHRCTICGRTDISDPELEFRYCSRCNGYFCYCEEHINCHTHVQ